MRHDKQTTLMVDRVIAQIETDLRRQKASLRADAARLDDMLRTLKALRDGEPFVTVSRGQALVFQQPRCGYPRDDYDHVARSEAKRRGLRPCKECS